MKKSFLGPNGLHTLLFYLEALKCREPAWVMRGGETGRKVVGKLFVGEFIVHILKLTF